MSMGADELIGQVVASQFRVERKLGEGGMGAVYLAEQLEMERKVVLKVMHARMLGGGTDFGGEERFKREARIVAQLNHPNVVQVHAFGRTDGGQPYIAMEYVEGRTLADVLRERAPLPEARTLLIVDQISSALIEAHERGLVHRDLKPENIMLADRYGNADHVKVLDFGIATMRSSGEPRLTKVGAVIGTAEYMAPEQARAQPVDQRTDIYALGVILYEMLTGKLPFSADNVVDYLLKQVSAPVELPTRRFPGLVISARAEAIIARALEKEPLYRFPSASDMQREVRGALAELSGGEETISPSFEGRRPSSSSLAGAHGVGASSKEGGATGAVAGGTAALSPVTTDARTTSERRSSLPETTTTAALHPAATAALPPTTTLAGAASEKDRGVGERNADPSATGIPVVAAPSRARRGLLLAAAGLAGAAVTYRFGPFSRFGAKGLYMPPGARLIEGLPVPEGAELHIASPQALMVYVTAQDPHSIFDFYLRQAQAWGRARREVNVIQFTDDRSPVSHVNISGDGNRFLVVLGRNVLLPAHREPAPTEIFGAPLPPGAIMALLMTVSATYNVNRPTSEVMAFYKEKLGTAPDLTLSENATANQPSLFLSVSAKTREFAQITVVATPPSMRPSEGDWSQITVIKRTQ